MNKKKLWLLLLLFFFLIIIPVKMHPLDKDSIPPGLGNPVVHRISEDIYAVTGLYHTAIGRGFYTNAGIIFTSGSVIFIDSGMTISSAEFLWKTASERMKGDEKLYLILTHHHSDHIFGMRVFKEKGARIIAHSMVKEELKDDNGYYKQFIIKRMDWDSKKGDEILGDVVLYVPDQTLEKDTVLNIDGEEIYILVTPGHVPDELCVYHPKSKTLFAGDAVYEGSALATRFGGPEEWKTWISQLNRLKTLEIATIVPGHGKLCSESEIDRNIDYLKEVLKKNKNLSAK
jgi:glyoxylase-like metal-dependent hydrolase (beta-lactamase superfamily II)